MVQRGCGGCSNVGHVSGFHATPRSMAYHCLDQRGVPLFSVSVSVHMHASRLTHTQHDNWEANCACGKDALCAMATGCDAALLCDFMTLTQAFPLLLQYKGHTESV